MKTITPQLLKDWLKDKKVTLIDVREPFEHKAESISGAHLIPLSEISLSKVPEEKQAVVIHCQSGKRSAAACEKLLKENPSLDVYSLEGGILAWKTEGFDVYRSTKCLPIERQQQIVAGFLTFGGIILGAFLSPGFYWISAFVGLGLMTSGFTGWCGMAKLLAKMPWNK